MRLLADFKEALSCFWFFPLKTLLFVMEIKKGFQFLANLDHLFSRLTRLFSQKLPKLLSDRGLFCI